MTHLDDLVDALAPDDKVILMAHNGHLSKDASNLYFRPQRNAFWGYGSWLRSLGYGIDERVRRRPLDMYGGSIGNHVHDRFGGQVLSIWMLYGRGQLMGRDGPVNMRLHGDTIESLLAQVGDRFLLPLDDVDPRAREVLARANFRSAGGYYASADLTTQADALYFVKTVSAEDD
jgi:erythromycin esterase-like protein